MLDNIIIGQYLPINSLIHRLDARTKILIVSAFITTVFLANNLITYLIAFAYVAVMITLSQVPLRYIIKGLKPVFILVAITFLLHTFLTHEGTLWFEFGIFKIYSGGVLRGIAMALRFLLLVTMASLLTLTTTPIELTDGIESLLRPLKKIKLPVHEFALMMSIALRFIPTLLEEADKIMKAQMARGVEFTTGPLKSRIKAIVPLLIPLFVSAFKRAEELATAMEARGYRGDIGRTRFRELRMGNADYLMLFAVALITAVLIWLKA